MNNPNPTASEANQIIALLKDQIATLNNQIEEYSIKREMRPRISVYQ
jgi:hypothetical protein